MKRFHFWSIVLSAVMLGMSCVYSAFSPPEHSDGEPVVSTVVTAEMARKQAERVLA